MSDSLCTGGLNRMSTFGFSCTRCIACCRFKKIQLNPYEIARLARNRDISTTEFIARYTTNGGTILKFGDDGKCIFLNADGCSVHPDRPLVCRLYPLGRHVRYPAEETFSLIETDEGCKGVYRENGAIERYLEEQGAGPFMHAADRYLELLWGLLEVLENRETGSSRSEIVMRAVRAVADTGTSGHDLSWIDMDRAVSNYCRQSGIPVPTEVEEKMAMHIRAVREWTE